MTCLTCSVECSLAVSSGACGTQLFKPSVRTTCYFQGVFTTMAPICVVSVCIYMCVKIILPYYSVTAQFKLTLFPPLLLLLLLLCLYRSRSLKVNMYHLGVDECMICVHSSSYVSSFQASVVNLL